MCDRIVRVNRARPQFTMTILAASCVAGLAVSAHAQCEYDVTFIESHICNDGGFPVSARFQGRAMNDLGWVVGKGRRCDKTWLFMPAIWKPGWEQSAELASPDWLVNGDAVAVNNAGDVACNGGGLPDVGRRPFIVRSDGTIDVLPAATPDATHAEALDMNDDGVVVGYTDGGPGDTRVACMWINGSIHLLDTPEGMDSQARAIDENGVVYGRIEPPGLDLPAYWIDGVRYDLPLTMKTTQGYVLDAINPGTIVGVASLPGEHKLGEPQPAAWIDGDMQLLEKPASYTNGWALLVNRYGQVWGRVFDGDEPDVYVVWQHREAIPIVDLLEPGQFEQVSRPYAANDRGQVLATVRPIVGFSGEAVLTPMVLGIEDLDLDCRVNEHDLQRLIDAWGNPDPIIDLDASGVVDVADLLMLLNAWTG